MNAQFLYVDAQAVKAHIADLLAVYPELLEDESLRLDTLEGETDMFAIIAKALNERFEAEGMATAIKERASDLYARQKRFERKADAMKKLIKALMDAADQDKITLPEATLSVTAPRTTVNVIDADQLPQGYFRIERIADKKAIGEALKAGNAIPGAELALGEEGLTIRPK